MSKTYQHPSIVRVALTHVCPKCGKASMYDGLLTVRDHCPVCQFPLKEHDAGDGPAFFAMSIAGTIVILLALILELTVTLPLWLHVILWFPAIIALSVYFLRMSKSILVASQYKNDVLGFKKKR